MDIMRNTAIVLILLILLLNVSAANVSGTWNAYTKSIIDDESNYTITFQDRPVGEQR